MNLCQSFPSLVSSQTKMKPIDSHGARDIFQITGKNETHISYYIKEKNKTCQLKMKKYQHKNAKTPKIHRSRVRLKHEKRKIM